MPSVTFKHCGEEEDMKELHMQDFDAAMKNKIEEPDKLLIKYNKNIINGVPLRRSSSSMATKYNIGDPVWAKMKGFSPWPGKVANPTKEVKRPALKKPMQCIFFFGTNNYAWIQEDQIKPYEASKEQFSKSSKTASFKEALEAIEDYVKNLPEQPVRSSDLPSIDEEISTIFPNGSVSPITNTPTKGPPAARVSASENETEDIPLVSPMTQLKVPKTPKEPSTGDKEPRRRKRESQDQAHRASKRTSSESSSTGSAPAKRNKAAAVAEKSSSAAAATPNNNTSSLNSITNATSSSSKPSSNLLRQSYITRPVTPPLDVERISDVLREKRVSPSNLKFGFLGLGNMGQGMVKNLLNSGHHITVWNRTPSKV
ncbi:hypothetical protein V5799_012614 [Amblyomma americanum]|uniref:PWWP domain-containing protein n=1 Tax=Amblyomma americanum TaxID=6943 RepID=A0AAQ4EDM2_AMBAM